MKKLRSAGFIIAASFLYGWIPVLTKVIYTSGGNSFNVSFYTALFSVPVLWLMLKWRGIPMKVDRATAKKLLIVGLFGSSATILLLYYSYSRISAGMATTLHFIYPIMVAVILALFYHEKMNMLKILALVLAVSGIAVISGGGAGGDLLGIVCAVVSGCCWAFYMAYLEKSGLAEMDGCLVCMYMAMVNVVVCGAAAFALGEMQPITTDIAWVLIVVSMIIGRVVAGPVFQVGIRGVGSMVSGILSTLEPITSMVVGWLILDEELTATKIFGAVLVLSGVFVIIYSGARESKSAAAREKAAQTE